MKLIKSKSYMSSWKERVSERLIGSHGILSLRSRMTKRRIAAIVIALVLVGGYFLHTGKGSKATWFDDSYAYRKKITIGNSGAAISSARKVLVEVDTAALTTDKMQADCDDTRFTDINGKVLRHFIDTDSGACDTSSTDYYVELTSVTTGDNIIYMYYGNPAAISNRSPEFFAPDANSSLGNKLKAYWALDEISGTRYDFAHTNDLTDNATVTSATGKISNAADFEQDNSEYLNRADNADLSTGSTDYTFAAWINAEAISATTNQDLVIAKKWDDDTADQEFTLRVKSGASPSIKIEVTNSSSSGGTIAAGTWYFVVASVDFLGGGLASYTVHVNDVQRISSGGTVTERDGTADFQIGGNSPVLADGKYFDGLIDNAMFWKRTLTAAERTALYNGGNGMAFGMLSFTPTSGPTLASEEKTPGLVAYWRFDDGQGSTAQDSTVNNNDGTLGTGSSAPTWTEESRCVSGKCLQFDGTNDYVDFNSPTALSFAAPGSVSSWVRTNSDSGQTLFSVTDKDTVSLWTIFIGNSITGSLTNELITISRYSGGVETYTLGYTTATRTELIDGKWHHIEVTADGSTTKIYLDGVQKTVTVGTGSNNGTFTNVSNVDTAGVGSVIYGGSARATFLNGFIDEPKIYPYARTAAQIQADFAKASSAKGGGVLGAADTSALSNGLVGYWKMDESSWTNDCSTSTVTDSSGNAKHGKSCPNGSGSTTPTSGKFGSGGNFDGTDDYVSISPLGLTSGTVSMWLKPSETNTDRRLFSPSSATLTQDGSIAIDATQSDYDIYLWNQSGGGWLQLVNLSSDWSNQWHHLIVVYTGGQATGYWDGVKKSTVTSDFDFNSVSVYLGGKFGGTFGSTYYGVMDEVRVYNRALSDSEISQLYEFAPGPVGHWKMDEGSWNGTTDEVKDISGNGYHGTASGGATTATGKYGKAGRFDGTDDYVDAGTGLTMSSANFTVSAWVKSAANGQSNAVPVGKVTGGSSGWMFYENAGNFNFFVYDYADDFVSMGASLPLNTWTHITGVSTDTETCLYKDGALVDCDTKGAGSYVESGAALRFGRYGINANYFNGSVDDVRIYNYARTSKQIVEDMNAGHPAGGSPVSSMLGYWNFDEQQGQTTNNKGFGSSINGTLGASSSVASDDPTWKTKANCKVNGCLLFDAANDYVNLADNAAWDQTAMTMSAWVYPQNFNDGDKIAVRDDGSSNRFWQIQLSGTSGAVQFLGNAGSLWAYNIVSTRNLTQNAWNHVAVTVNDVTDTAYIYINGRVAGSDTASADMSTGARAIEIGGGTSVTTNSLDGYIDEFKFYNVPLSAAEVLVDMNARASVDYGTTTNEDSGNSPVAEWKMDEGSDGTCVGGTNDVCDTSGMGNDGAISGATWKNAATCKEGKCLSFDGSDDYVLSTTTTNFGTSHTVSFWIKPTTLYNYGDPVSAGTTDYVLTFVTYADGHMHYGVGNGSSSWGNPVTTSAGTFVNNRWYHITGVADGTNITLYIDGVKYDSAANTNTVGTKSISIGRRGNTVYPFNGLVDNLKVYNYARTAAQIAQDYKRGLPVAHWKLDECQGSTAYDASGNGYNGTITIGASGETTVGDCTTSSTAWGDGATGKFNSGLSLDGTDDFALVTGTTALEPTSSFAVSMWVKPTSTWNSSSGIKLLLSRGTQATNANYALSLGCVATSHPGSLCFTTYSGAYYEAYTSTTSWTAGTWYHVVGVIDGANVQIYVNGQLNGTQISNRTGSFTATGNIRIGCYLSDCTLFADMVADDVRIYNYALSAAQVRNVMNDGAVRFGPATGSP